MRKRVTCGLAHVRYVIRQSSLFASRLLYSPRSYALRRCFEANVGITVGHNLVVFAHSAITPLKVNRF